MKRLMQLLALIFSIMIIKHPVYAQNTGSPVALAIHGGAGVILKENMNPEMEHEIVKALSRALDEGWHILKNGGSGIDAVTAAIVFMEDSPLFNAGKGSVFTSEGKNEMDASIMDGRTLNAGAVAMTTSIKNPVLAACAVMEKSSHVMLAGEGAEKFAGEQGIQIVDPSYFYTERRKKALDEIRKRESEEGLNHEPIDREDHRKHGTVGAVALDDGGNLAAATSTGGMTNKKYGRIGDSPIIGAGTYADNATCAISCTGHGEYFIRLVVARSVAALMEYKGMSVQEAGAEIVMKKLTATGGTGGAIILDKQGNLAMPFNTPGMYRAFVRSDGSKTILLYGEE